MHTNIQGFLKIISNDSFLSPFDLPPIVDPKEDRVPQPAKGATTLPETNFLPVKIGRDPKRKVLFQPSICRGYVSFREGSKKLLLSRLLNMDPYNGL